MKEEILKFLKEKRQAKTKELVDFFWKDRTTIYRWLKKLEMEWEVEQVKKWTYKLKEKIENYFNNPVWERKKVSYNPDFLKNYIPNETYFFSKENLKKLENAIKDLPIDTDFYKTNKRFLETLLIDLSFASSYLEGNTYSYLDTEVVLKYNEINKEKTSEETQMILNHKRLLNIWFIIKKNLILINKLFLKYILFCEKNYF